MSIQRSLGGSGSSQPTAEIFEELKNLIHSVFPNSTNAQQIVMQSIMQTAWLEGYSAGLDEGNKIFRTRPEEQ